MRPISFSDLRSWTRDALWSTDFRKGLTASVGVHALLTGVVLASMVDWRLPEPIPPEPDQKLITFDIAGPQTDSEEKASIPELAPPTAVEESAGPETDAPVEEIAFLEGGSGVDDMIWTPAPPGAEGREAVEGVGEGTPVPQMEFIELPENGVEPTLVSYDMGKFSGARALSEAARLQGSGSLKMLVVIDEEGNPQGCSVVTTSGSNVLDDLGCNLVMTYRYEPGKDGSGRPIVTTAYELLEWNTDRAGSRNDASFGRKTLDEEERRELEEERESLGDFVDTTGR